MGIFKLIIQIIMFLLIIGTIKIIKKDNLKYKIENYIISIVIYIVIIMLLF